MKHGYIQVYTGNGKGKTTAALGLALRAAGAGLKVFIAQFMKTGDYSEIQALRHYATHITVEQFGLGRFIKGEPSTADISAAQSGLDAVRRALTGGKYQIVIMDEGNVAASLGLIAVEDLLSAMTMKPETVELVITGRGADLRVVAKADLVTEMNAVKHYYQAGVPARTGIEK